MNKGVNGKTKITCGSPLSGQALFTCHLGSGQVLLFASISQLPKTTQKVKSQQPFSKYEMPTSHARDLLNIIE